MPDWRGRGRHRSAAKERAQVGLTEARDAYPTDIGVTRLPMQTRMAIYVATTHPLAGQHEVQADELHGWRELRLSTYRARGNARPGPVWSAPNYLLLLSMAVQGFGWCVLPCALVEEFAAKSLVQLNVPGWPRAIGIDLLWNKRSSRRRRKLAAAVSAGRTLILVIKLTIFKQLR